MEEEIPDDSTILETNMISVSFFFTEPKAAPMKGKLKGHHHH